jgi:hypothetical protein
MTNLIVAVSIFMLTTTNDVTRWRADTYRDGQTEWVMYNDEMGRFQSGKEYKGEELLGLIMTPGMMGTGFDYNGQFERVRIVKVTKRTALSFDWAGAPRKWVNDELLSEKRILITKKEVWEEK